MLLHNDALSDCYIAFLPVDGFDDVPKVSFLVSRCLSVVDNFVPFLRSLVNRSIIFSHPEMSLLPSLSIHIFAQQVQNFTQLDNYHKLGENSFVLFREHFLYCLLDTLLRGTVLIEKRCAVVFALTVNSDCSALDLCL